MENHEELKDIHQEIENVGGCRCRNVTKIMNGLENESRDLRELMCDIGSDIMKEIENKWKEN